MTSDDHCQLVFLQKGGEPLLSELVDHTCLKIVHLFILNDSLLQVARTIIWPQEINYDLWIPVLCGKHFDRSFYVLNLLNRCNGLPDACMHTEDLVLNECCKGQPFEYLVYSLIDRILIKEVLLQSVMTLFGKPKEFIHLRVLVAASQKEYVLWISEFQSK